MGKKIAYVYAFDGLADWEIGYLTSELASGRYFRRDANAPILKTFAQSLESVETMGSLRIAPDLELKDIRLEDAALLVLPGGDSWTNYRDHDGIAELARDFLAAGIPVAAICGATVALGRAGLLDDRPHTSNDLGYLKAVCPEYRGERLYKEEDVVSDGTLVTASGLAPLEFAREVLNLLGVMKDETLEAWYGLYRTRTSAQYFALEASMQEPALPEAELHGAALIGASA